MEAIKGTDVGKQRVADYEERLARAMVEYSSPAADVPKQDGRLPGGAADAPTEDGQRRVPEGAPSAINAERAPLLADGPTGGMALRTPSNKPGPSAGEPTEPVDYVYAPRDSVG